MNIYRPPGPGERRGPPGPPPRVGGPARTDTTVEFPTGYLRRGYFDEKGNLWPGLIVEDASQVARVLGLKDRQAELKTTQLRRFYGKAKNVEQKLDAGQEFESLKAEILGLQPMAANAVARGTATSVFKEFMDRNVTLAIIDEKHFRKGFLVHFQSVVAYFTYIKGG